ncbi:MAG: hypothetical protein AAF502_23575 [Bacteroidota bacterium]
MKNSVIAFFSVIFIITLMSSCSKDEIQAAQSATSLQGCMEVSGVEAIYWDIFNGFARGDIPGGVPTIKNPGGTYFHPAQPLLGFQYPAGWTPETVNDGVNIGVNLIKNDNQGVWRYNNSTVSGFVSVDDVRAFEINQLLSFFGSAGGVQTVCEDQGVNFPAPGITMSGSTKLIRFGGITANVTVSVTTVEGLPSSFIFSQVTAGPTADLETNILDVYLPIGWQLLYTGQGFLDSDNDGVADENDAEPFNPNVQ